ncbi:hypothetical protein [Salicibibacter kimchii]|uniref:Uncharacterized protein n=1 Tax=Salicibibacter kimchii TaxID=2099786 RepID=A0A345BUJ8_9BACI|nr:hypothetical protein [Salicibibacter kimchii]AXF54629.1 hypothetical protein DT065_00440 [Salicibibacter kimchii]
MTDERKQEVTSNLMSVYDTFEPVKEDFIFKPSMFWLISNYNQKYDNPELIGGDWVIKNCPSPLKDLQP